MNEKDLILCFKETIDLICTNEELINLTNCAKENTKVYNSGNKSTIKACNKTEISVEEMTSFACAKSYVGNNKIAVLNFANPVNVGGGVLNGAMAQEECLCRSSNLYPCIAQEKVFADYYSYHKALNNTIYSDKLIYTKGVTIFRTDDECPVTMPVDDWFEVDVITCAAPYYPSCDGLNDNTLLKVFEKRIDNILNAALLNGVQIIILGAFGCGAFENPPEIVAKAFNNSIKKVNGKFSNIVFAIKPSKDENCPNVIAFKNEFELASKRTLINTKDLQKTIVKSLDKTKELSKNVATKVGVTAVAAVDATKTAISNTVDNINTSIEEKKQEEQRIRKQQVDIAMDTLVDTYAITVIDALGASPIEMTKSNISKIQSIFPVPREQCVLWADAEFDLRPSGIVLTEKGVFIKTNIEIIDAKGSLSKIKKTFDKNNKTETVNEKSVLYFYAWEDFEPNFFIGDSILENNALKVEQQCSEKFILTCTNLAIKKETFENRIESYDVYEETYEELLTQIVPIASVGLQSAESAVFIENKAAINNLAGHGEMVEEATTLIDRLHGLDAKVVGRDNAKNGADRQIGNDVFIQSKYYNSATGTLESSFDAQTGNYRYYENGNPMQLEVPKDQYESVLAKFKHKIEQGKVPSVTDPNKAKDYVRQGRYTYKQAVNLTKAGTIESLTYDAMTGVVASACAFGITFAITAFITWQKTKDLSQSIEAGIDAGIKVFGLSFLNHILVSQVSRTSLANSLMAPSNYIVGKLGTTASKNIVNSIRALAGKKAIGGAAATKSLAKILRSNVLVSAITFTVFSIPETYNLITAKISASQYAKNISVLCGSMAGAAGGTLAAGATVAKIGGVGGAVAGPAGVAIGIAGGFVGGIVGAAVVGGVGNTLYEGDVVALSRLLNAILSSMINEYLLSSEEIDKLVSKLGEIKSKEYKTFFTELRNADEQEKYIQEFLEPLFDDVIKDRKQFLLPSDDKIETFIIKDTDLNAELVLS